MSLDKFADAITVKMWERVARVNWRPFEEAREFARSLKLKSGKAWRAYCRSGKKPADIPAAPHYIYADAGWLAYSDWLGTRRRGRNWRPFAKARAFVRKLKLQNAEEWTEYCKSSKRPLDIPTSPSVVYADAGWISLADWLGNGRFSGDWRPFEEARAFVRKLRLKGEVEWRKYCGSGKKPADIPSAPWDVYADAGWKNSADWLGKLGYRQFRPFKEARAFIRKLKLNGFKEWYAYRTSRKKPADIPATPERAYADAGWKDFYDWFGKARNRWRPFKEARAFVRGLKLKGHKEWNAYCCSGEKPADIPTKPEEAYADMGWIGMGDWLGKKGWRSFKNARMFARRLKLKSSARWTAYCVSGKKPDDIPARPDYVYANAGWKGWYDWLGTDQPVEFLSFKEARVFARGLGFTSNREWRALVRSGKKPTNFPANPDQTYANSGWNGWPDFLGNSTPVAGNANSAAAP